MNETATTAPEQEPAQTAAALFRMPLLGEPAPAFQAPTTRGPIDFPKDHAGKWVMLCSPPAAKA